MKSWRLAGWTLLFLAALGILLGRYPLRLPTYQARLAPTIPLRQEQHAVLLLIQHGARAPALDAARTQLEWVNLLEQRFGGCDVVTADELQQDAAQILRDRMLIVIPRALSAQLDSTLAPALDAVVRRGADVLLEAPAGFWSRRLGLQARELDARTQLAWPSSDAARRSEHWSVAPEPIPFRHEVVSYWPKLGELGLAQARLHPTGRPLGFALAVGRGRWLVLGLDLAGMARRMRQGEASADGRLRPRHGAPPGDAPTTMDLVSLTELLRSDVAWLDRWLDAVFDPEFLGSPWPRLWPASFDADGFLLLLHEMRPDATADRWMARAETADGLPSTLFQVATDSLSPIELPAATTARVEIGLLSHWPRQLAWRQPELPRRLFGLFGYFPFGRPLSLAEQQARWSAAHGGSAARVQRSFGGRWDVEVDRPFECMAAAGVELDCSFGPRGDAAGWLYGSAMPFRPLASDGSLHRVRELPCLATSLEQLNPERLRRWLRHNGDGGHGPIALGIRPDSFATLPSTRSFALWEQLPELAQSQAHRPIGSLALLEFWRQREATRLHVRWDGRWLEVEVAPLAASDPSLPTRALAVAQSWRERPLGSWQADWPQPRTRRSSSYGRSELLLELPSSGGLARFEYAPEP